MRSEDERVDRRFERRGRRAIGVRSGALGALLAAASLALAAGPEAPAAPTPAERQVARAEAAIAKDASASRGHAELAMACARRARETSDVTWYARAETAIETALRLDPRNLEAQKARCWVLLGQHRFASARDAARDLNRRFPDDVQIYGFLVDANVELGDYPAAEAAAQWMLDIRPGNVPGLTRGAYLREIFGDLDGAEELMAEALQQVAPTEGEDRAWILTQIAHLRLESGDADGAARITADALREFPDYHYALSIRARALGASGDLAGAVALLARRASLAPHAENRFDLAQALARAGREDEARAEFAAFVSAARDEMDSDDNANRELILYYADHGDDPAEALRIARREIERRQDVHTLDAYAWALLRAGDAAEARRQIDRALAVGTRDTRILEHAREIRRAAGGPPAPDPAQARFR